MILTLSATTLADKTLILVNSSHFGSCFMPFLPACGSIFHATHSHAQGHSLTLWQKVRVLLVRKGILSFLKDNDNDSESQNYPLSSAKLAG